MCARDGVVRIHRCVCTCVAIYACAAVVVRYEEGSLCVGLECVLGRSALTFRRGRAMVSRLLLRAG